MVDAYVFLAVSFGGQTLPSTEDVESIVLFSSQWLGAYAWWGDDLAPTSFFPFPHFFIFPCL